MDAISKLLKRLNASHGEVILFRSNDCVGPEKTKVYLDGLIRRISQDGTLVLLGDCDLNTDAMNSTYLMQMSNQERFVLSSDKMMQLLTLRRDSNFAYHPALMLASIGKYAKLFSRPRELDFPFGDESVFSDLYDLNALILFVSAKHVPFEAKFALSALDNKVIVKNSSVLDEDIVSYLDVDCDYEYLHGLVFGSGRMLYEMDGDTIIYGIRYREYIDLIREEMSR